MKLEEQRKMAGLNGAWCETKDEYLFGIDSLSAYTAAVEAKERERCAITAWTAGMQEYTKARGMPCDAREVGAMAARDIRSLK